MTTDTEMLQSLLEDDRLTDEERDAFRDMQDGLTSKKKLSKKQKAWAESRWKQLELDSDEALNLMSSGKVPRGKECVLDFERMPRPAKPPGRR